MWQTMRTTGAVMILAGWALACPALAEDPPSGAALTIIEAAAATDLFTDASDGALPRARHLPSGLLCSFAPTGRTNRIVVVGGALPRGDDVACITDVADGFQTLYATRFAAPITAQQAMANATAEVLQASPDFKPFTGAVTEMGGKGKSQPVVARFEGTLRGVPVFTRLALTRVNGWIVMQRITTPLERASEADIRAQLDFTAVLLDLDKHAPKARSKG